MNPLNWKKEEKIATAICIFIGALIGVVIGYFAYAVSEDASGSYSFYRWAGSSLQQDFCRYCTHVHENIYLWAIFGAFIAFCIVLARRLFQS